MLGQFVIADGHFNPTQGFVWVRICKHTRAINREGSILSKDAKYNLYEY